MSYYYQISKNQSEGIIDVLDKMDAYDHLVFTWISNHFKIGVEDEFVVFNEIPEFSRAIVIKNPEIKDLTKKGSYRLSQRNADANALIKDWKKYKTDNGYRVNESWDRSEYGWLLRRIFPTGRVRMVLDERNAIFYAETQHEHTSVHLVEMSPKEFKLKEIELLEGVE